MVYYSFALGTLPGFLVVNNLINGLIEIVTLIPVALLINQKWFYRSSGLALVFFLTAAAAIFTVLMMQMSEGDGKYSIIRNM